MLRPIQPISATILLVLAASIPAQSQARPDLRKLTCDQANKTIAGKGGVVMSTGSHTFDRFVASRDNCMVGEIMRAETVKTADGNCRLNVCKQRRNFRD